MKKKWSKADDQLREAENRLLPSFITNPEQVKLDFSQFHDLSHSVAHCMFPRGCDCHRYGGWRHHVALAWAYKWKGELRAATLCRLSLRHPWTTWHRRDGTSEVRCRDCGKPGSSGASRLS